MAQEHNPKPDDAKPQTIEDAKLDDVSGGYTHIDMGKGIMVPSVTPSPKPRP